MWHGIAGIDRKVHDDLLKLGLVCHNIRQEATGVKVYCDIFADQTADLFSMFSTDKLTFTGLISSTCFLLNARI